ncbi:MAG: RecX family transcriptional regulator [Chloroflexi bacterium]|nr:RecX family transcriptional regulator [Chloroflexota bacterium]
MLQKITALKLQKKNRQRVNVYLDGEYAFGLHALLAAPLKVGQSLSPEEIEQLRERDALEVAYERALDFLSYRPRSRAEVEAYLQRHRVPDPTIQGVIERLSTAGLLDDEAFARYWVENREAFRPRGQRLLRFELRRKGVPDVVVEEAIEAVDEAESAYRAARDRARQLSHLDYQIFYRRLSGFLQRRGFDYEVVKETVKRLWLELRGSATEESL